MNEERKQDCMGKKIRDERMKEGSMEGRKERKKAKRKKVRKDNCGNTKRRKDGRHDASKNSSNHSH